MGDKVESLRVAFTRGITGENVNEAGLSRVLKASKDIFDATTFLASIQYQGFNRQAFIKAVLSKMSPVMLLQFALIGAVRGTNFDKVIKNVESIPPDMIATYKANFKTKATKSDDITISRCTAAIPQWVSYFLLTSEKRFPELDCPACLQFPAAGALPMSREMRIAHIQFSVKFSTVIGGQFNKAIYKAMMQNAIPTSDVPDELRAYLGIVNSEVSNDVELIDSVSNEKLLKS